MFIGAERRLAAATDRIVAISPRIREELVHDYRIGRAEQYRVVPLGFDLKALAAIDDDARAAARAALHIPPGVPVVTTVGRLTAIKDQMLFLEVAQRVAGEHGSAVFLVTGDGELRASLERAAERFHIADRVRFLGWRRDLETVYGAADIFLLTSRNEGTPVALIESLAAGCAGVSTDVGGVADVMPTTDVGLLAAARSVEQLADHVSRLIADPQRRRAMGEAGRRLVLARYGIERLVSDIDGLYRDLLD
jgi:glycosyltransferase involved in cell wall biosynthesis